jgi:ligand-binding sensor domain-containing protein
VQKSIILFIVYFFFATIHCYGQILPLQFNQNDTFATEVRPLLDRYCSQCHAPERSAVEFLRPTTQEQAKQLPNSFASVFHQVGNERMPPGNAEQPTAAERKRITKWIYETFHFQAADFDQFSAYVVETFEDSKGNLWFGTVTDGAARFDGETLTWYSAKESVGETVTSITEDQQGNIWFGSDLGVTKFDGVRFTNYSNEAGLPGTRCYILIDRNKTIWVGTEKGVFRFNGSTFSKLDIPAPAIDDRSWKVEYGKVWCLSQDRKGNIWIARDGLGACRYDGQSFTHFTKNDGLCSNNVSNIIEDQAGNIWFSCLSSDHPNNISDGGLNRFDGTTLIKFPETKGLFDNDIYTIYPAPSGSVWIGATGVGIYRYEQEKFTLFHETDKPYWTRYLGIQSMLEDRNGTLWIGFSGGLFRFNGQSFVNVGKADLNRTTKP